MVVCNLVTDSFNYELYMAIDSLLNKTLPQGLDLSMDGSNFPLNALQGKPFILYFYPKDNTSGCTKQACDLRDMIEEFNKRDLAIFGVSKDNAVSHKRFIDTFSLNFPLLTDESGTVCDVFGVWKQKSMYGNVYFGVERSTFYIDDSFTIRHIWRKVKVPNHWNDVLKTIDSL